MRDRVMVRVARWWAPRHGAGGPRFQALVIAAAIGIAATAPVAAQPTRTPSPTPPPPKSEKDQQIDTLAKAWTSLYAGKHEDVVKAVEPLLKAKDESVRVEAGHLQARAFWSAGTKASMSRAEQMWAALQKSSTLTTLKERLQIVKALSLEAEGSLKLPQAVEVLEELLKGRPEGLVFAEAAIELGRLYVKARRFEDAQKALEFAGAALAKDKLARLELSESQAAPFLAAARKALGNIQYEKDPGRKEFEEAERLRKSEKFAEAVRAYQAVLKDFAATDYATRSDLSLGYCMVALRQPNTAAAHWKKFIAAAPAGAWRGQAYVALTDLLLDQQLDLPEAGKYADLAKASLSTGLADEKAGESWQEVAYDIYLRVGTVAWIQGKSDAAAEAFEQAKKALPRKAPVAAAEGLDSLIAAARGGKPVIPDDVKPPASAGGAVAAAPADKRAAAALSIGTIYRVARRSDAAESFFERVTGKPAVPSKGPGEMGVPAMPPMPGASPAQQAFATFSKAAILLAREPEDNVKTRAQAKEMLLASIRAFSAGSWHDETLYCLATLAQGDAESAFGQKSLDRAKAEAEKKAKGAGGHAARPKSPTTQEAENQKKAETERLAKLRKALGEAVPYWTELVKRFPESPRCEQAFYNLGVICCQCEQWKEAGETLDKFVRGYPRSPLAGDAYIRLIDNDLERLFALGLAKGHADAGMDWARNCSGVMPSGRRTPAVQPATTEVPGNTDPWRSAGPSPDPEVPRAVCYHLLIRDGLVAYLSQEYDKSAVSFAQAASFAPPREYAVIIGSIPRGVETLTEVARAHRNVTPADAMAGGDQACLILQLADVYHIAEDYDKSMELGSLVISPSATLRCTPEQRSWAHFRRGRSLFCLSRERRDPNGAMEEYLASVRLAPRAGWADQALFLAGNIMFNTRHDTDGAIALWRRVINEYPRSPEGARCAYYIGFAYEYEKRPQEARASYEALLRDYPDSPFAGPVRRQHLPRVSDLEKETASRANPAPRGKDTP